MRGNVGAQKKCFFIYYLEKKFEISFPSDNEVKIYENKKTTGNDKKSQNRRKTRKIVERRKKFLQAFFNVALLQFTSDIFPMIPFIGFNNFITNHVRKFIGDMQLNRFMMLSANMGVIGKGRPRKIWISDLPPLV